MFPDFINWKQVVQIFRSFNTLLPLRQISSLSFSRRLRSVSLVSYWLGLTFSRCDLERPTTSGSASCSVYLLPSLAFSVFKISSQWKCAHEDRLTCIQFLAISHHDSANASRTRGENKWVRGSLALAERAAVMCINSLPGPKFNTWWKILYSIIPPSQGLCQLSCKGGNFILFYKTFWPQRLSVCM